MKGYNNLFLQLLATCDFFRIDDWFNMAPRHKVHTYRAKIQSQFSRKQSLKRKIFILYFRHLFSPRITPFPLVPPVTNHPVYIVNFESLNLYFKARNLVRAFHVHLAQIKNSSTYETFSWCYFSIHVSLSGGVPKMLALAGIDKIRNHLVANPIFCIPFGLTLTSSEVRLIN